ncbi:hypothetical protein [Morganella morganii]|uniref:hypothetical protein n=1 Tax=Morganella morganii TaxID=582 RepID=UPI001BD9CA80|nr:hypothetical protein [Morganella morganii]MBT0422037.1 hypothetical protein [Morganella morganii subsp. morganii]MBT0516635.1 hypothetical protein [Morganella morganii subsp. morganii]QWM04982.1 hypothetical protein IZ185_04395 [Morganella morganii subsp. morganii]
MDISQAGIELMQHALGINQQNRKPYRNYFLSSGKNEEWESLIKNGLAASNPAPKEFCGDIYYQVTDNGIKLAISKLPVQKKLTRYDEFLNADSCLSFAEWLGIELPEYEYRYRGDKCEYRMYRKKRNQWWDFTRTEGEWMPTMKAAKASYKEALKASR